ncbi:hypothetical protein DEU56DRAFT_801098 [Suillus clintonianus]|uniref:uncharacterized protein n=1 Tax=Suillus clintonianus TaxID=1904413 RepID=UPI001B861022|nr:uncharacterized protein DEU56DRAFT_801098 [Suillus clintonianus]KAG2138961.1 hypothetical protein DEU56DRAFT_801098 [Suillus clintonianus]
MSAVSHGTRHLRQGIGGTKHYAPGSGPARSLHIPAFTPPLRAPQPSTAQRLFTNSRNLVSRFFAHLTTPGLAHSASTVAVAPSHSLVRPAHFHSITQSVKASYSLPVRHALYRPLSLPCLPRPPSIPGNVANVGLGTVRSFHSARPIFQNVVDNVPIATRALWEAEWEFNGKKKNEARKLRKAKENMVPPKTKEMLKPKQRSIVAEIPTEIDISELDHYLPQPALPEVTTYLLVPLAPTPTARLPLSAYSTGTSALHPLLPVPAIAAEHRMHRNHSLRVSTLFSRLDAANVWDDPGVGVDAYAFGPSLGPGSADNPSDEQCTILRVTLAGWTAAQVRGVIGESGQGWCTPEEVYLDTMSASSQMSAIDDEHVSSSPQSVASTLELDSASLSELDFDKDADVEVFSDIESDDWDYGIGLTTSPGVQDNFVLPTLDFSSSFAQVASPTQSWAPPPQIFLRTASELAEDFGNVWSPASSSSLSPSLSCDLLSDLEADAFPHVAKSEMERSWLGISMGLSSSFTEKLEAPR